ncbi:glycosyltransferase family 2 protein [Fulvivirga sediminis]|nr:glycosyltransferase family 2 protein [Fulvivirga sediminis]
MAAYNAERYVSAAIDSILNQTYTDFELIIADDGSNDKTRKIIDSYTDPRIVISHNQFNRGKVATVNSLIEKARGQYLTIHDADDISRLDRFELQIAALVDDCQVDMVGSNYISFMSNRLMSTSNLPLDSEMISSFLEDRKPALHGPTTILRMKVLDKVGPLYRNFTHGEDIDFNLRFIGYFKAKNLCDPLYYYRMNKTSLTKSIRYFNNERVINSDLIYKLHGIRLRTPNINDLEKLEDVKLELLQKTIKDPSYPFRFGANYLYHQGLNLNSWLLSVKSITNNPLDFKNYVCFMEISFLTIKSEIRNLISRKKRFLNIHEINKK